jgi:SH3-like domain-containing protein
MKTSKVMDEIRKIRDENSMRHLTMTNEEISKEHSEAVEWFIAKLGKPIEIVTATNS